MVKGMDEMKKDAKMDMTPMIDCVFLLMIFFVLVIDLSQQDLEALILQHEDRIPQAHAHDIRHESLFRIVRYPVHIIRGRSCLDPFFP